MSFDRATVRALMDLMSIEGCDFCYNESNDYGVITAKLFTGEGDARRFMGEEEQSDFRDGRRGNGHFKLNESGIDRIIQLLNEAAS